MTFRGRARKERGDAGRSEQEGEGGEGGGVCHVLEGQVQPSPWSLLH